MPRRRKKGDVSATQEDVALLERVVEREDLDEYERGAFEHMLEDLCERVEEYGDDAYPLTDKQREWAERVAARVKRRLNGREFAEYVLSVIGRKLRLFNERGPRRVE